MIIKDYYSVNHMWLKPGENVKAYFIAHFVYVELGDCKLEPRALIKKYERLLEKAKYDNPI